MSSNVNRFRHSERGMSIVEVLMVVMIMTVVMVAVMGLYLPAQRSTVVQTQLSDIQSDLRLALRTMTKDILTAGFYVPDNPIIFQASATPTTAENVDPLDFTIQTRIIGNGFARVLQNTATLSAVPVADPKMADNFPDNSYVRIFDVSGNEIEEADNSESERVYQVLNTETGTTPATFNIVDSNFPALNPNVLTEGTVIVRVLDNTQPALQTIRYILSGDTLERRLNEGSPNAQRQILARNLDVANSGFSYEKTTGTERVKLVAIKLTGKTRELNTAEGAIEKSRAIETSVKIRNVF